MLRRAGAKRRECGLYDRELSAGAAFVLAGFSAGTGVCARGERWSNSECGVWNAKLKRDGRMEKRRRRAIAENPFHTLRFMFRSIRVQASGNLLQRFVRLTPVVCHVSAKQDGLRCVALFVPRGSESPFVRSHMSCGYRACLVHFGIVCFLLAIPTELRPGAYMKRNDAHRGVPFHMVCFLRRCRRESVGGLKCGSGTAAFLDSPHVVRGRVPLCQTLQ